MLARACLCLLTCLGAGCAPAQVVDADHPRATGEAGPGWGVARLTGEVDGLIRAHVATWEEAGRPVPPEGLSRTGESASPLVRHTLRDPLGGLVAIETHLARAVAAATRDRPDLSGFLTLHRPDRPVFPPPDLPFVSPTQASLVELVAFIEAVLVRAHDLREQALADLSPDERRFLFERAGALAADFSPQYRDPAAEEATRVASAGTFVTLVRDKLDLRPLLAAAHLFLSLQDPTWLQELDHARVLATGEVTRPPGVTGPLVASHRTPVGWIVIGGRGDNEYDLAGDVACLLDLGGSDRYRGWVAAAHALPGGNHLIIDLDGDDRYDGSALGLATGRLGVGMLLDLAGDDEYRMAAGAGGTGFAGIGLLLDVEGRDRYVGTKVSQGAAIGGLGIVIDRQGDDERTAHGYAIGFGGPSGLGAVVDRAGDDRYTCGDHYPSSYNASEAPDATPGDPRFQYDGFCLGVGVGQRVLTGTESESPHQLAGGLGLLVDEAGDDRYRSANFSQGTGYFWGLGVKVDGAGRDEHGAARYGHGASAHRGVGLFIDAAGEDRYGSRGPAFNGGTAWDGSVAAFLDAGPQEDRYDLASSDGLGRAAHGSWSLAVDEAGDDHYRLSRGLGLADEGSVSAFVDLGGADAYPAGPAFDGWAPANGRTIPRGGGLFVDR